MSDRDEAKRSADKAVSFFDRCVARGLSRAEAVQLTAAYLLGQKVEIPDEESEEWRRE